MLPSQRRLSLTTVAVWCVAGWALAGPAPADETPWWDRLLWNAEERTRRGAEALAAQEYGQAAAAMDDALELAPEDPVARYNAGTARLPTDPEAARSLLDGAAEAGPADLAARASYNLGNSHLEEQDFGAAIDAYKDALRRDPDLDDAKFNLELARRLLEQQQQQNQDQQNQDQQNQDQQNQDQQNQDQQNQDQQNQDQQNQDQQNQDQQNQDQQNQDQQGSGQQEQESPLPQFEDLEDMSAEEAAAILEAIENMEREQRRQEALEAAKTNNRRKKDW